LVTGASGIGKSRFLHEVAVRLLALTPRTLTLRARANASSGDEPWSVFAQSIRSALDEGLTVSDLFDGETVEEAELIHELLRIPVDSPSVKLESARQDPHIMADQVRLALLAVTTRGATRRPMLLVLDNLDAADGETLDLVGRALSDPRTGGLAVLAASRAKLPTLAWPELSEIHLGPLSRDACIEVVQNALGDDVDEHRAAILVERSEGNPFWLEELVRMEASGASDALPETVVASVQARLERLPKDARRLLRAASVFGLEFPLLPAGTLAGLRGEAIERCLAALVEAELVFPGALGTYDLRHDVIRRAAYEMLTDVDRAAAHAAAAAWLESVEGHDPRLVADHYELAGLADRAVSHHGRAAEIALGFCDFGAAVERAERALSASSDGETRGWLHYIRAEAAYWVGEPDLAVSDADEVLRLLPEGTPRWLDAKRIECGVYVQRGEMGRVIAIARALEATMPAAGHERALAATMARLASHTFLAGDADLAKRLLAKAEAHVDAHGADPLLEATIHDARARRAELSRAYVGERQERRLAGDLFEAVGARRRLCIARTNLGVAEMHIGLYEASRASLEEARALAIDLGVGSAATAAECNLGHVLSLAGEHDLGRSMLASSSARSRATGNLRFEGACAAHLARLELAVDRNVEAIRAAEEAVALLESAPTLHGYALATLAEALLAREEGERALPLADRATRAARTGVLEEGDIYTLVVHARVCAVLGRTEDAKALLAEALTEIDARAEQLDDAESRRAFLEAIPENVVARALMRDL
jgi:tetratricopeptide (TPR) repeat protein